tara:strand:+ start:136 stop:396 length:261 start_codon:yes stop_codon:yes gene_type:complete
LSDEFDYTDRDCGLEPPLAANLLLDAETRMWRLELQGPAAMILFFLLDNAESSITNKLWNEAKFDQIMKFDIGELDYDAGTPDWES